MDSQEIKLRLEILYANLDELWELIYEANNPIYRASLMFRVIEQEDKISFLEKHSLN